MSETTETNATIEVTDLKEFIQLLTRWHTHAVATVNHMRDIPEGTKVEAEDGSHFVLEGDTLEAFKLGIGIGLEFLGELPFTADYEPAGTTH